MPGLDDAVTLHHTCRSRPARVVRARRGSARARRPLQPWLSVPLMYLGLMFVAIFPVALTVDEICMGACALRLRAFLGVGHRVSSAPLVSGDGHRKRGRLPGTPFPVSARNEEGEALKTLAWVWGSEAPAFSVGYTSEKLGPADSGFTVLYADAPDPSELDEQAQHPDVAIVCLDCLIDDDPGLGRGLEIAREHGAAGLTTGGSDAKAGTRLACDTWRTQRLPLPGPGRDGRDYVDGVHGGGQKGGPETERLIDAMGGIRPSIDDDDVWVALLEEMTESFKKMGPRP